MCGIAGIFYFRTKQHEPNHRHQAVLDALQHRGPDFQKHSAYPLADLYHSRLSILDLSEASHQPFENSDKSCALTFNGEIFNHNNLIVSSNRRRTTGDSEVLFQLLNDKQEKALPFLNGFFSFGFIDNRKHELLLARDRFGIKPLYYYLDDEKLIFASELKALLCLSGPLELNHEQVYTYFRLNYCAGGERIFKGVRQLAPGTVLKANRNGASVTSWYEPSANVTTGRLEPLLADAVKLRLQADVPVGCFLSGGLDSSIISALAKREQPGLKTFSIGFTDHRYLDESRYAEAVARHIQSSHQSYRLSEDDFLHHLPGFLDAIDEPFADSSAFNVYLLSKLSRSEIKVALSGDGADELFKGYLKHKALHYSQHALAGTLSLLGRWALNYLPASREHRIQNKIRQLRKLGELRGLNAEGQQELLASISNEQECRHLIRASVSGQNFKTLFTDSGNFSRYDLKDWFDLNVVLAEDMLVKMDRFSMRHGLEIRNPFLDFRVVEFALGLEHQQKISTRQQKIILREQLAHLLPSKILHRPKKGFELPLRSWLCGQLKEQMDTVWLNEEKIKTEGLLNPDAIRRLKAQLFSGNPGDSAAKIWALIVFEHWLNHYQSFIKHNA